MKHSIGWKAGWLWVVLALTAFAVILIGQTKLPEGEGKQLVEDTCALSCHGAESWSELRMSKEDWDPLVRDMSSRGEAKSEKEIDLMTSYLAKYYGPEKASEPAPNTDKPADSEGKQLVEDTCSLSCHGAESWSELRMSKEDWDPLVRDMSSRGEAKSEKEIDAMTSYLAKYYGPEKASEPAPNTDKPSE